MHSSIVRGAAALAGLTLAFGLAACSTPSSAEDTASDDTAAGTFASGDENTLVFATLPDHEGADQDAQPIADWIAAITGKDVEFFEATDYTAVVQGLAAGQIDIAQISAFTYYQAQNAGADIVPIGAQITSEGAEPGYYSVALKNPAATDVTSLADFADRPVCFVNPTSTSGRAIPAGQLKSAGVTVSEENTVFGEEHDLTAAKIAEGVDCQVGFAQDVDADPLIESGALEEIDRYLVPAAPIVMQAGLPQALQDQLIEAIADSTQSSLTDAGVELNEFLTENWFGFGKVDDSYYDNIRTVCDEVADIVEACAA
ncbi:phosphate/phosphite/phosphonate ABC transporter substrate-binding protein [Agromyces protaetiae]|uniref:Phosphate/phosphite/phosphonate ABC transporter substrate-binding protein n=1 Tax=Agromyces protaetiae TaxID=2509455 RepID=A0A4P6FAI1_9MICO|nr:PhnD/SsuA/transferrin family substrate-binding protein [Agromyces protaetiae]QAY73220.1 phosphate/phosphite/phosphonate ABC transporter substrate-binding protein [Agromyces protaetiae]